MNKIKEYGIQKANAHITVAEACVQNVLGEYDLQLDPDCSYNYKLQKSIDDQQLTHHNLIHKNFQQKCFNKKKCELQVDGSSFSDECLSKITYR